MELNLGGPFAWSTPSDAVRWTCLALAALLPLAWRNASPRLCRAIAWVGPLAAAALSTGYVVHYLRGGPRIIDATAYFLQARALADGHVTLPTGEPELSVLGRFLVRSATAPATASVIFPPGWPFVLALGFRLGAPLAVGPLLAAALCVGTARLARTACREFGDDVACERAAASATLASVMCAALRYHTADTMSHGLAALCVVVAVERGWCALSKNSRVDAMLAGLAAGGLFATRPTTALGLAGTLTLAVFAHRRAGQRKWPSLKLLLAFGVGTLGPAALWFAHQHAATGSLFATAQGRYYAQSDGPPGCFRYGFGGGIGCIGEHGDFVRHNLSAGYGLLAALGTSGRRLLLHVTDVANFGPLALLVILGARGRGRLARVLLAGVFIQLAVYAPFYFDGSYPGGGARMLADVLPLEHVLVALALSGAGVSSARTWTRKNAAFLALSLGGFAFGAGRDHDLLRDREGGHPMFDEAVLARHGVDASRTLVFVDTDHGFDLAFGRGRRVARSHNDALDRLAWEAHGRPSAVRYRYRFDDGSADVSPVAFDVAATTLLPLRIEGESLWPPVEQTRGWVWPTWEVPACASNGHALRLHGDDATVALELPRGLGARDLRPVVVTTTGTAGQLALAIDGTTTHVWSVTASASPGCLELEPVALPAGPRAVRLRLEGRAWALDALNLSETH